MFARDVRGRTAGLVFCTDNLAVSALGFISAAAFRAGQDWTLMLYAGAVPVALALLAFVPMPDDRRLVPIDGLSNG